jgi:hypothetical protein
MDELWIGPLDIALSLALIVIAAWYWWRKRQQEKEEKLSAFRVPGHGNV